MMKHMDYDIILGPLKVLEPHFRGDLGLEYRV